MFEVLLAIGVFVALLLLGVPVAFSIFAGCVAGVYALGRVPMEVIAQQSFSQTSSYELLAIPFFILTADLLFGGTLGKQVIGLATRVVGRLRGGVGMTSVLTSLVFSGVSGSAVADATGLGKVLIPWTKRIGYPASYGAAVNASSSVIGIIVPPSIPMILYSAASGASIAAVFTAGIVPGVIMAAVLMIGCWIVAMWQKLPTVKAKLTPKKLLTDLLLATPAILIPVILIRVVLFTGIATVTEVSVLTTAYALLLRFLIYRDMNWRSFVRSVAESAAASAVVLLLVMFSSALAWLFTMQQAPQLMADFLTSTFTTPAMVTTAIIITLILVGMFLDMSPAILLLTPVLLPTAEAIGMGPIHLGILMVVTLALGLYTPPVGTTLYISASIGRVSIVETTKQLVPFYVMTLIVILLVAYLPGVMAISG